MVTWAKVFGILAKMFQQGCQNCAPRVHSDPMKKRFCKKSEKVFFFVYWAAIFDIMVFFLGYCSQEKVYSRCPEDEFKKNWKLKIFLSLWYLRLKFLAPRTELRVEGEWGLSSFQCMRTVEPWGEVKNLVNLLHYMSFSVIESLIGSLFLSCGWKKRGKISKLHSIRPEKRFEERFFILCKEKLHSFIILNFRQKNSLFGDKLLAR